MLPASHPGDRVSLSLPRREASIMRRYFRGALALAAVGLLCSTGARANTLTQNSSWTVDRSGTSTKYRVVAYGDSIYAGYNGSITSAAIFAAPTVSGDYASNYWG